MQYSAKSIQPALVLNAEAILLTELNDYCERGTIPSFDRAICDDLKTVHYPLMKGYPILIKDMASMIFSSCTVEVNTAVNLALYDLAIELNELNIQLPNSPSCQTDMNLDFVVSIWPATKSKHKNMYDDLMSDISTDNWSNALSNLNVIMLFWRQLHDSFVFCIHKLLNVVRTLSGEVEVLSVLKKSALCSKDIYRQWSNLSPKQLQDTIVTLLHAHGSQFSFEYFEGQVNVINIHSCASGGMLLNHEDIGLIKSNAYVEERKDTTRLENRHNYSSYCAHCVMWNEQLPQHWFNKTFFTTNPDPEKPGVCQLVFCDKKLSSDFSKNFFLQPDVDF